MRRYRTVLLACGALAATFVTVEAGWGDGIDYEKKYTELAKQFETVKQDRDNVLIQAKRLMEEKTALVEQAMAAEKVVAEKAQADAQLQEALGKAAALEEQIRQLGASQAALAAERDTLGKELEAARSEGRAAELEKSNMVLQKDVKALQYEVTTLTRKLEGAQESAVRLQTTINEAQETNRLLTEENAIAARKNRMFQNEIKKLPKKFAEIARQNKMLIKETAKMHYNLGVYYTKNKEYQRAATEFEKAIEIDPQDCQAYFNLGYIYAEYMVKRSKAVEYFRRYLVLAKDDDKDIDWVRRYLLTWEAYDGKLPIQ